VLRRLQHRERLRIRRVVLALPPKRLAGIVGYEAKPGEVLEDCGLEFR
jgi:hypothetical protein